MDSMLGGGKEGISASTAFAPGSLFGRRGVEWGVGVLIEGLSFDREEAVF